MIRCKSLGGNSGIIAYEVKADSITIKFNNGATYLYNYRTPSMAAVEQMKALAIKGKGLNSYISRAVKSRYQSKLC